MSSGDTVEGVEAFIEAQNEVVEEFIPVEYKVVVLSRVPGNKLEDVFNEIGKDGWDLVVCVDGRAIFSRC